MDNINELDKEKSTAYYDISEEVMNETPEGKKIPLKPQDEKSKPAKKVYQFDLIKLEKDLDEAYTAFKADESELTRTNLFTSIRDLAYAILRVSNASSKLKIDLEEAAYNYGLYLFERLVTGTFVPTYETRMPWQSYIDMNIRHILFPRGQDQSWLELVEDLEFLVESSGIGVELSNTTETYHQEMGKKQIAEQLFDALKLFYTEDEIKKKLPLTLELIFSDSKHYVNDRMPKDIQDFATVTIAMSKRLATQYGLSEMGKTSKNEMSRLFSSSVRSTVFLASVVNSDFFPRELLLSLDIDSLYRLVQISGGKKMRIPTQRELNTLVGAVVTVSKMVMEGKDLKNSLNETKRDFDLVFSHQVNIQTFCSKIVQSMSLFGEVDKSTPLISLILMSIKSLEKLFNEFTDKIDQADPETLLKSYEIMSHTMETMTDVLTKLQVQMNKPKSQTT